MPASVKCQSERDEVKCKDIYCVCNRCVSLLARTSRHLQNVFLLCTTFALKFSKANNNLCVFFAGIEVGQDVTPCAFRHTTEASTHKAFPKKLNVNVLLKYNYIKSTEMRKRKENSYCGIAFGVTGTHQE